MALVLCIQSKLKDASSELKCVAVEKHEGQLAGPYFSYFSPLLLSSHGSKNLCIPTITVEDKKF